MALAVRDLELTDLPATVDVEPHHDGAWFLLRRHGRPVGALQRRAEDGVVSTDGLEAELRATTDHGLDEARVDRFLGRALGASPTVTLAVCTHERPDDLRACLEAVTRVRGVDEILVIDSGPRTEAAARVTAEFPSVRRVAEERTGLDRARNRAVSEARTDVIAFTDDDARPDPDWVESLRSRFDDPLVMAATGLTVPSELETPAQIDHERFSTFGRGYRRRTLEAVRRSPGAAGNAGAGVNFALRREALRLVGPFDEALDAGTATRSGGDTEMFHRILGRGYRIAYEPTAVVRHRHRREADALEEAFFGYGVGVYAAFTASLLREREFSSVRHGLVWLLKHQLRDLWSAATEKPGALPPRLGFVRFCGSLLGPMIYVTARWMR